MNLLLKLEVHEKEELSFTGQAEKDRRKRNSIVSDNK